ncbi:MAG: type II toxin-antitoxin system Phd/YefM family antitoxin [Burkholderiales bacterium]
MDVGIHKAKTQLSKLIERVQKGERITITRHGKPVAKLVPMRRHDREAVQQALQRLRAFREKLAARGVRVDVKELIEEGRWF